MHRSSSPVRRYKRMRKRTRKRKRKRKGKRKRREKRMKRRTMKKTQTKMRKREMIGRADAGGWKGEPGSTRFASDVERTLNVDEASVPIRSEQFQKAREGNVKAEFEG